MKGSGLEAFPARCFTFDKPDIENNGEGP